MKCHSLKQYMITMLMMAIVFLFWINGCSMTKAAVTPSMQLGTENNNYSNINMTETVGNFDIHIFTNNEEALIVPCYYWKIINTAEN